MQGNEVNGSIGSMVVAIDEYWGTYSGVLQEVEHTRAGVVGKVRIIENIVKPCQHAIFFPQNRYDREPYAPGSVKGFKIENIERDEPYE